MLCVPAENDVLTNKMYYPGTYYPGCTVFAGGPINATMTLPLDFVDFNLRVLPICQFIMPPLPGFLLPMYRVTIHHVQNLPLTSKLKLRLGLARSGQAKTELLFEVNERFCTR